MKRLIAAVSLGLLAASGSATAQSGAFVRSPLDRPPAGIVDPLEVRNPLAQPPSANAPLPPLPGSGMSKPSGDLQPRPLLQPGQNPGSAPLYSAPPP